MDSSKFFPTALTAFCGAELTEDPRTFLSTIGPDGKWAKDAYWLGWIRPENLPGALCESRWDDSGSTVNLINYAKQQQKNYSIGYYSLAPSILNGERPGGNVSYAYRTNQDDWVLRPSTPYPTNDSYKQPGTLLNAFYPQRDGVCTYISEITFRIFYRYGTSLPLSNYDNVEKTIQGKDFCSSAADFISFCKGERSATFNTTILGDTRTFTFTPSSEAWQHYTDTWGNYMVDYYIGIVDYRFYGNYSNHGIDQVPSCWPVPMIQYAWENTSFTYAMIKAGHRGQIAYSTGQSTSYSHYTEFIFHESSQTLETYTGNFNFAFNETFIGGAEASFPKSEIMDSPRSPGAFIVSGNCLLSYEWANGTDRVYALFIARTADDLFRHLALMPRIYWGYNGQYTHGIEGLGEDIYISEVLPSNEFTANLLTGTEEFLGNQLRDWQKEDGNIADSDYVDEDKPNYTPPIPDAPGEEPNEGDRGAAIINYNPSSMSTTEFIHYAAMSTFAIQELSSGLWSVPDTIWEAIKAATTENPMDFFISLRYYPIKFVHNTPQSDLYIGHNAKLHIANNYYPINAVEDFGFGTVNITRQYGNFLDYQPYTGISIFLPFAGMFDLNPTIVMGRTLSLRLSVDVSDGSGVWSLYNETDQQPVFIKQCRIAADIPLTGLDASQMASNIINASLQTAQHAINSGAGLATTILGGLASGEGQSVSSVGIKGGPESGIFNIQGLSDAYNRAQASKEIPQYTGGSSGAAAQIYNHTPYIVYRRPLCTNPENYAHTVGNLVNKTARISSLNGLTSCRNVDTSGIGQATDKEKAQIKKILESGFYA